MITTIEIVLLVMLSIGVGVAIWWLFIAGRYRNYLNDYSYARGANAVGGSTANLSCDPGATICIYRATQICTLPNANNFESTSLDPIAVGSPALDGGNAQYGDFNPATTIDLTQDMVKQCNGQTKTSYAFQPQAGWIAPNGVACNGQSQLIATYACVPKAQTCQSWSPKP